jgi:hypothetical protein
MSGEIELYEVINEKNVLMGRCNVKMEELLRAPLKRIPGSVVRVHDV